MKTYHHGNLKEELIACACKLCDRDGYTKLSIRSLAKESGVSQTAPYRHFETKECVYAAVATVGFKKLNELVFFDSPKKITKTKIVINKNNFNKIFIIELPTLGCLLYLSCILYGLI